MVLASSRLDLNPDYVAISPFCSSSVDINPENSSGIHGRNYYMIVWELCNGRICGIDNDWFTSYPHVLLWEVIDKRDCHTMEFVTG